MHFSGRVLMLSLNDGAEAGGSSVIKHQTKETMATILLARAGNSQYNEIYLLKLR